MPEIKPDWRRNKLVKIFQIYLYFTHSYRHSLQMLSHIKFALNFLPDGS